jgi:transcriptional regulator with XRE-family HTH domain
METADNHLIDKERFLRDLAKQIAKVRRLKGYSQDRLSLEAGFARSTLSRLEKGVSDPQASTLAAIAAVLGVPIADLFPPVRRHR